MDAQSGAWIFVSAKYVMDQIYFEFVLLGLCPTELAALMQI